jgi:hypothetical protein
MVDEDPPSSDGPYCSQCGTEIDAGVQFCSTCGTPVGDEISEVGTDDPLEEVKSQVRELERNDVSVRRGAVVGGVAFVATYALTAFAALISSDSSLSEFTSDGVSIPLWKVAGWVFYSAHGGEVGVSVGGSSTGVGFVSSPLIYALPPVVLVAAGYVLASESDSATRTAMLKGGATVAVGYGVLSAVGVFLTKYSMSMIVTLSVEPDPVTGILLAGVLYPVAFGTVGGALAYELSTVERTERDKLERKGKIGVAALVLLVVAGSAFTSGLVITRGNPADLEVTDWRGGQLSSYSDELEAEIEIQNTGDETVVTSLETVVDINGGGEYTASKKITVAPGETKSYDLSIGSVNSLSSSERRSLNEGYWTFRVLIDGEIRVNQ